MSCNKSGTTPNMNGSLTYYYSNNTAIYPGYSGGNAQYDFFGESNIAFNNYSVGMKFYALLFNRKGINEPDSIGALVHWNIVELFNNDFHINCDSVDIYFKKQ